MRRLALNYIDVPGLRPGTIGAYAFAFLCAGVATALRVAIDPYIVGSQFITVYPAVVITTLISGFGAGVSCTVLSAAAVSFFVLSPHFSFYIDHPGEVIAVLLFILVSLMNVIFVTGLRIAAERDRELSAALRESEQRLGVVVAELQHRTRNLISVVGAVADNTLRTSETFDEFRATFHDRLGALGRAQGLLFRMKESGRVSFDELINNELAAQSIRVGEPGPVTLDGPKGVRLRSGTVQPLAMVLYELVTNAIKYGALKQPNGHLTIRWRQEIGADGKPWLHLDWKESGVEMPPVGVTFQSAGHGRELIERALPYQFGAQTTFAMEPDGVHCTISLPASQH